MKSVASLILSLICTCASAQEALFQSGGRIDPSSVKKTIKTRAHARGADDAGRPLIIAAVQDSQLGVVRHLLSLGADVNATDKEGNTPLFHAVSQSDEAIVKLLLSNGADLSRRYGDAKQTILFEAVRLGSLPILKLLLKRAPNLAKETDANGDTAAFEAVRSAHSGALKEVLRSGTPKDTKNKAGQRAIDLAQPGVDDKLVQILK